MSHKLLVETPTTNNIEYVVEEKNLKGESEPRMWIVGEYMMAGHKNKNGRIPACEIMIANSAIRNLVRENKIYQIPSLIQGGSQDGMQTLDQDLQRLLHQGLIERKEAIKIAENAEVFEKGVF